MSCVTQRNVRFVCDVQAPRGATSSSTTCLRSSGTPSWPRCSCPSATSSAPRCTSTAPPIRASASVRTIGLFFLFFLLLFLTCRVSMHWCCWLVSWYSELSQPQRVTSGLKQTSVCLLFTLDTSSNQKTKQKSLENYKISSDTDLQKTKHTQTSMLECSTLAD